MSNDPLKELQKLIDNIKSFETYTETLNNQQITSSENIFIQSNRLYGNDEDARWEQQNQRAGQKIQEIVETTHNILKKNI